MTTRPFSAHGAHTPTSIARATKNQTSIFLQSWPGLSVLYPFLASGSIHLPSFHRGRLDQVAIQAAGHVAACAVVLGPLGSVQPRPPPRAGQLHACSGQEPPKTTNRTRRDRLSPPRMLAVGVQPCARLALLGGLEEGNRACKLGQSCILWDWLGWAGSGARQLPQVPSQLPLAPSQGWVVASACWRGFGTKRRAHVTVPALVAQSGLQGAVGTHLGVPSQKTGHGNSSWRASNLASRVLGQVRSFREGFEPGWSCFPRPIRPFWGRPAVGGGGGESESGAESTLV